nr:PaaI family thioesterase [uncultured Oscillibacter sp.]
MDFQKIADYRNTHNPYAQRLGILVEELGAGRARVTKTVTAEDLNSLGRAHGGIYFSVADIACGSAMATHGYVAVTVNASYNFFRSANVGDKLTAEATEVKSGKTICVYDVRITDQNGALLGTGSFTFYRSEQKLDI